MYLEFLIFNKLFAPKDDIKLEQKTKCDHNRNNDL